jgi:general stress protein 26
LAKATPQHQSCSSNAPSSSAAVSIGAAITARGVGTGVASRCLTECGLVKSGPHLRKPTRWNKTDFHALTTKRMEAPMTTLIDHQLAATASSKTQVIWSLMDKMACMLVTHDGSEDRIRARPMNAHVRPEQNAVHFLTDARAHKDDEVLKNNSVCLAFSDAANQKYVSLTGTAIISNDRQLISELWTLAAAAWWQDKTDPNIRVLSVTPVRAEYWDCPDVITTVAQSAEKALSGNRPDCGTNGKVTF